MRSPADHQTAHHLILLLFSLIVCLSWSLFHPLAGVVTGLAVYGAGMWSYRVARMDATAAHEAEQEAQTHYP